MLAAAASNPPSSKSHRDHEIYTWATVYIPSREMLRSWSCPTSMPVADFRRCVLAFLLKFLLTCSRRRPSLRIRIPSSGREARHASFQRDDHTALPAAPGSAPAALRATSTEATDGLSAFDEGSAYPDSLPDLADFELPGPRMPTLGHHDDAAAADFDPSFFAHDPGRVYGCAVAPTAQPLPSAGALSSLTARG